MNREELQALINQAWELYEETFNEEPVFVKVTMTNKTTGFVDDFVVLHFKPQEPEHKILVSKTSEYSEEGVSEKFFLIKNKHYENE